MTSTRILRKMFTLFLAIHLSAAVFAADGKSDESGKYLQKGKAAYEAEDYQTAVRLLFLASDLDDSAEAQFMLGECYQNGKGVEEDFDRALNWYGKAAEQGHAEAKAAIASFGVPGVRNEIIKLPDGVVMVMIKVVPGTFEMSVKDGENQSNEVPHRVTLTRDFFIGRTEVTQAQWKVVMGDTPLAFKKDNLPVEFVSWYDAMDFCEKLNAMGKAPDGWKFTLPTETQWEYAARGGNKSKGFKYSGSNSLDEVAWYMDNSCGEMHPVGRKKANELGLCDMVANMWEWCLDDWNDDSSRQKAEFSRGNDRNGSMRVRRGACFGSAGKYCRPGERAGSNPGSRGRDLGFRVALVPESY